MPTDVIYVLWKSWEFLGDPRMVLASIPVIKRGNGQVTVASCRETSFKTRLRTGEYFDTREAAIADFQGQVRGLELQLKRAQSDLDAMRAETE